MKSIAVVLILFGLCATGIGVYFIRQSQVASTQSKAYVPQTAIFSNILADCDYVRVPNCPDRYLGKLPQIAITEETSQILNKHASKTLLEYREDVAVDFFGKIGKPVDLAVEKEYSVADIISRVSIASDVDHRLLITILAIQGNEAWNGKTSASNAFHRKELSFAQQLAAVALELRREFEIQVENPTQVVVNGGTEYAFSTQYVSTASRALYSYLAKSSNPEDFRRFISLQSAEPLSFVSMNQTIFPSPAERLY